MKDSDKRRDDFFNQLELSQVTINNYSSALNGTFVSDIITGIDDNYKSIFEITDLEILWRIYTKINLHPVNIANHRGYSCPIMKYIRFLNGGKKYGKRIDANKKKPRKKRAQKNQTALE